MARRVVVARSFCPEITELRAIRHRRRRTVQHEIRRHELAHEIAGRKIHNHHAAIARTFHAQVVRLGIGGRLAHGQDHDGALPQRRAIVIEQRRNHGLGGRSAHVSELGGRHAVRTGDACDRHVAEAVLIRSNLPQQARIVRRRDVERGVGIARLARTDDDHRAPLLGGVGDRRGTPRKKNMARRDRATQVRGVRRRHEAHLRNAPQLELGQPGPHLIARLEVVLHEDLRVLVRAERVQQAVVRRHEQHRWPTRGARRAQIAVVCSRWNDGGGVLQERRIAQRQAIRGLQQGRLRARRRPERVVLPAAAVRPHQRVEHVAAVCIAISNLRQVEGRAGQAVRVDVQLQPRPEAHCADAQIERRQVVRSCVDARAELLRVDAARQGAVLELILVVQHIADLRHVGRAARRGLALAGAAPDALFDDAARAQRLADVVDADGFEAVLRVGVDARGARVQRPREHLADHGGRRDGRREHLDGRSGRGDDRRRHGAASQGQLVEEVEIRARRALRPIGRMPDGQHVHRHVRRIQLGRLLNRKGAAIRDTVVQVRAAVGEHRDDVLAARAVRVAVDRILGQRLEMRVHVVARPHVRHDVRKLIAQRSRVVGLDQLQLALDVVVGRGARREVVGARHRLRRRAIEERPGHAEVDVAPQGAQCAREAEAARRRGRLRQHAVRGKQAELRGRPQSVQDAVLAGGHRARHQQVADAPSFAVHRRTFSRALLPRLHQELRKVGRRRIRAVPLDPLARRRPDDAAARIVQRGRRRHHRQVQHRLPRRAQVVQLLRAGGRQRELGLRARGVVQRRRQRQHLPLGRRSVRAAHEGRWRGLRIRIAEHQHALEARAAAHVRASVGQRQRAGHPRLVEGNVRDIKAHPRHLDVARRAVAQRHRRRLARAAVRAVARRVRGSGAMQRIDRVVAAQDVREAGNADGIAEHLRRRRNRLRRLRHRHVFAGVAGEGAADHLAHGGPARLLVGHRGVDRAAQRRLVRADAVLHRGRRVRHQQHFRQHDRIRDGAQRGQQAEKNQEPKGLAQSQHRVPPSCRTATVRR